MRVNLSIPVTHPVGAGLLMELDSQGWQRYRVDLNEDHEQATAQLREAADLPALDFTFLLFHGTMRRHNGDVWTRGPMLLHVQDTMIKMRDLGLLQRENAPTLEIANEPDIAHDRWKESPEDLASVFAACYRTIRSFSPKVRVLTPSVSNLNKRGFDYLKAMYRAQTNRVLDIPDAAECAVHRYPHHGQPELAHDGFRDRDEEVAKLTSIIGGRHFHVTEFGYANYERRDGERISDEEQARILEKEIRFWREHGATSAFLYQINDGRFPHDADYDDKRLASYGIRCVNGKWKPIVDKVREMRGVGT